MRTFSRASARQKTLSSQPLSQLASQPDSAGLPTLFDQLVGGPGREADPEAALSELEPAQQQQQQQQQEQGGPLARQQVLGKSSAPKNGGGGGGATKRTAAGASSRTSLRNSGSASVPPRPLLQQGRPSAALEAAAAVGKGKGSARSQLSVGSKSPAAPVTQARASQAQQQGVPQAELRSPHQPEPSVGQHQQEAQGAQQHSPLSKRMRYDGAPPLADALPITEPAGPAAPPTAAAAPLLLPAAVARLLNPAAALAHRAAANTVMEAHELGEQQRVTDDAVWALDGLASKSGATRRESMATLVEMSAGRRGRLALRSGSLAADVLRAAVGADVEGDPKQALIAAALLLCFCQADADAGLLGRQDVSQLASRLLQVGESVPASTAGSGPVARVLQVLGEAPYRQQLPAEERSSPLSLALAALAGVLDPAQCGGALNSEPLKHALRGAGVLERAAQVAADHAHALREGHPTLSTVHALWRLHTALRLLENACFACSANEAQLVGAKVTTGLPPLTVTQGVVAWLAQQVAALGQQPLGPGLKKDCLRAALAVLMNVTQDNPAGCECVMACGGPAAVAPLLVQMVQGGAKTKGCANSQEELSDWVDELSGCLGLLINLAEQRGEWQAQLRSLAIDPGSTSLAGLAAAGGPSGGPAASPRRLLPVLCQLIAAVIPASPQPPPPSPHPAQASPAAAVPIAAGDPPAAGVPSSPLGPGLQLPGASGMSVISGASAGGGEVTLDSLEGGPAGAKQGEEEHSGAASIVELYASILLGFLVQGCPEAQREAAALLPTGSLAPVVAAVERCLLFYITAGAMTKGSEKSLKGLLTSLRQGDAATAAAPTCPAQQPQQEQPLAAP